MNEDCLKLTAYFGERDRVGGRYLADVVLDVYGRHARFFGRNADVPMMIVAVGEGRTIAPVVAELGAILRRPLLTLEPGVRVCKRDGKLLVRPHDLPATDPGGQIPWQKLTIHSSEQAHHRGQTLHQALIHGFRRAGMLGATVLRGIWGFHGDMPPHGDRLLQLRRRVPVMTVVVDTPTRIAKAFGIVDEVTHTNGLVTSEMVLRNAHENS